MAFSGDLKHLPIVDVVQLLNSARRSGILTIASRKGESQLVFKDGYIVSASHLNGSTRIGQILIDLQIITADTLEQALRKQASEGVDRKPLIITLIEMGAVDEDNAYKGLEQLIELTLVEILTWKNGKFVLESLASSDVCAFRYYPEKINREVNVNTQSILMDALRVYDEKMRDGLLSEEDSADEPIELTDLLSADLLGLSDMEERETVLHKEFEGLTPFDPAAFQHDRLAEVAPELTPEEREELAAFLVNYTINPDRADEKAGTEPVRSLLFFSGDRLMQHLVTTMGSHAGMEAAAVSEEQELEQSLSRAADGGTLPLLVLDAPGKANDRFSSDRLAALHRQLRQRYPAHTAIQLASPAYYRFTLHAYGTGVRAVLPCPLPEEKRPTFVRDMHLFLKAFSQYLQGMATE